MVKLRPRHWRSKPSLTLDDLTRWRGRGRAWFGLLLSDHGLLRYLYDNTHPVGSKAWRSFQPAPGHVRKFARRGVRTIINLRGESGAGYHVLEAEACLRQDVRLVNFRVYSRDVPSKEMLVAARDLFNSIDYPAMMHCKSGADRVGLMSVLYLFVHEKKPLEEALEHLSWRYGHIRQGKTGVLDHFFDAYREANASSPIAFYDWVETQYDPDAVRANFKPVWWGDWLVDRVLRRE